MLRGILTDEQCDEFNNKLLLDLEKQELNYCQLILPGRKGKLSVVGSYNPLLSQRTFFGLDKDLKIIERTDVENYFYGVSPRIDSDIIIEAISKLKILTVQDLDELIKEHHTEFMFPQSQKTVLLEMARYFIISIARNFGLKIEFETVAALHEFIQSNGFDKSRSENEKYRCFKTENNFLILYGCPTRDAIACFDDYRFEKIVTSTDKICRCRKKTHLEQGKILEDIYRDGEAIKLVNGKVFYSGAVLRVLRIDELSETMSNTDIVAMKISFERSSFGAIAALDHDVSCDPFLAESKVAIRNFFKTEDANRLRLVESNGKTVLQKVNEYLKVSGGVNQISVSGNIQLKNDTLLMCVRDSSAIDARKIYPSVNGTAEVVDDRVQFYKYSVNEDYPTIKIDDSRIDFYDELCRETFAELNLSLPRQNWLGQGLIICGKIDENATANPWEFKSRRMHFNIIAEQKVEQDLLQVAALSNCATEGYENERKIGVKVNYYKDGFDCIKKIGSTALKAVLKSNSTITAIFAILLFLSTGIVVEIKSVSSWKEILSIVFAFLTFFSTAVSVAAWWIKSRKKRKMTTNVTLFQNKNIILQIDKQVAKFLKKYKVHPCTIAALKLHLYGKIFRE